jgi:hypothetical protein
MDKHFGVETSDSANAPQNISHKVNLDVPMTKRELTQDVSVAQSTIRTSWLPVSEMLR